MWEFADSVTIIHGRHTVSVGADYRRCILIRNLDNDFFGDYSFRNDLVLSNGTNCPNGSGFVWYGNAVADYLLGYYQNVGGFFPAPLSNTSVAGKPAGHVFTYFAPYVQDDWKVTPRLTLKPRSALGLSRAAYEAKKPLLLAGQ